MGERALNQGLTINFLGNKGVKHSDVSITGLVDVFEKGINFK